MELAVPPEQLSRSRSPSFRPDAKQRTSIISKHKISDKIMEQILASFNSFDKDGDGTISVDEIEQVVQLIRPHIQDPVPGPEEIKNMVARVDLNSDGTVDLDEFITFIRPNLEQVIRADGDGLAVASGCGLLAVPSQSVVRNSNSDSGISDENLDVDNLEKFFKVYDRDGNGVITHDEIMDVMYQIDIPVSKQEVEQMTNGKNELTFDEFKQIITQPSSLKGSINSLQTAEAPIDSRRVHPQKSKANKTESCLACVIC